MDDNLDNGADLVHMMSEKAHEIFQLFDQEKKGFITKSDLLRLQNELPQTPEQLELVFNNLDIHGKGYLTLDEFTEGFGSFLGLPSSNSSILRSEIYEDEAFDSVFVSESQNFDEMIRSIGASDLLQEVGVIRSLWIRLHQNQPEMLDNFEDFLRRITAELKRTHMNYEALHASIESKRFAHDAEIRELYMEMESQISAEKERIRAEEKSKEKTLRDKLEMELNEKDNRLQELLAYQNEMEKKLMKLNEVEVHVKHENEKLLKEKEAVEERLDSSTQDLEESKSRILQLQKLQKERTRIRSLAASQINDWVVLERECLLRQLQELKDMNRKLLDSHDEMERQHQVFNHSPHIRMKSETLDDHVTTSIGRRSRQSLMEQKSFDEPELRLKERDQRTSETDLSGNQCQETIYSIAAKEGCREQPIGSSDSSDSFKEENYTNHNSISAPHRFYKIVFVGDSGVGKSSYIHRICKNSFISSFAATIGVDFQVHSVKVDDHIVALQLWDTAGQERFRSITKQYFRKADGVLVMYDVTSDASFRSMREWLEGIKETVEEETVILIVGNKLDLTENKEAKKAIRSAYGKEFAAEYGALFFETSAKSGFNISESIQQMARVLRDREDKEIKKVHDLTTCALEKSPPENASYRQKCCNF